MALWAVVTGRPTDLTRGSGSEAAPPQGEYKMKLEIGQAKGLEYELVYRLHLEQDGAHIDLKDDRGNLLLFIDEEGIQLVCNCTADCRTILLPTNDDGTIRVSK